jgi:hypothetical protein
MARRVLSEGAIKVSEGPAPKGQQDLAQGFNWEPPSHERRALKGRQIEFTYDAEVRSNWSTLQSRTLILCNDGYETHLVSCRPFRAKQFFLRFPGLKPWAKSCCPFGAGLSGRITCAKQIQILGYAFLVTSGHGLERSKLLRAV